MPEPQRAVIDRIVDGTAVILTEPDQTEHHLDAARLPAGAHEGSVVLVESQGEDGLTVVAVDEHETARRHADARDRLDALRKQRARGRFGPRDQEKR